MCNLPIEERWVSIPLGGVPVEKINLPFFYQLGTELRPITELKVTKENRIQSFTTCLRARGRIESLLSSYSTLTVCRSNLYPFHCLAGVGNEPARLLLMVRIWGKTLSSTM